MRILVSLLLFSLLLACNAEPKDRFAKKEMTPLEQLQDSINEGHIPPMGKMGKVDRYRLSAEKVIDSLDRLVASGKAEVKPLFAEADSVLKLLDYASFAMDKWMAEYQPDSMAQDKAMQMDYLRNEHLKVKNMSRAIDRALLRADSLFSRLAR